VSKDGHHVRKGKQVLLRLARRQRNTSAQKSPHSAGSNAARDANEAGAGHPPSRWASAAQHVADALIAGCWKRGDARDIVGRKLIAATESVGLAGITAAHVATVERGWEEYSQGWRKQLSHALRWYLRGLAALGAPNLEPLVKRPATEQQRNIVPHTARDERPRAGPVTGPALAHLLRRRAVARAAGRARRTRSTAVPRLRSAALDCPPGWLQKHACHSGDVL
jgi:hypothetical protein